MCLTLSILVKYNNSYTNILVLRLFEIFHISQQRISNINHSYLEFLLFVNDFNSDI